jgi:1-acyl-sn-glycerol-3-phosphate acyltransferase
MSPGIARGILGLFGWKVEGGIPASLRKYVVIAAPHTSWWDFFVGLLARAAIGRRVYFLGKDSLFRPPLGWLMRALGGYPVDRSRHTKLVDQVTEMFNTRTDFAISLAPEGTRKKVTEFKSGFYYIARGAHVPIICAQFDYFNKRVRFASPFYPTTDAEADLKLLWNHFVGVRGKIPASGITEPK